MFWNLSWTWSHQSFDPITGNHAFCFYHLSARISFSVYFKIWDLFHMSYISVSLPRFGRTENTLALPHPPSSISMVFLLEAILSLISVMFLSEGIFNICVFSSWVPPSPSWGKFQVILHKNLFKIQMISNNLWFRHSSLFNISFEAFQSPECMK